MLIRDKEQDEKLDETFINADLRSSIKNDTVRLLVGALAVITGLFKLLSPVQGNVPVLGDSIPALSGFATGFILVFEYYLKIGTIDITKYDKLEHILIHNKKRIGFLAIGIAVLHFLFPQALFI